MIPVRITLLIFAVLLLANLVYVPWFLYAPGESFGDGMSVESRQFRVGYGLIWAGPQHWEGGKPLSQTARAAMRIDFRVVALQSLAICIACAISTAVISLFLHSKRGSELAPIRSQ